MRLDFRHCNRLLIVLLVLLWAGPAVAFTTPTLRDNFERADEGPPPSANWSSHISSTETIGMITSNTGLKRGSSGPNAIGSAWWDATVFGPNVAMTFRLRQADGLSGKYVQLFVRLQEPSTAGPDGYYCQFEPATAIVRVFRLTNNVGTQLSSTNALTVVDNDLIGCEAIGSSIKAWVDTGGGWVEVASSNDVTYAAAGRVGVRFNTDDFVLDDFGADTLAGSVVNRRGIPLMAQ